MAILLEVEASENQVVSGIPEYLTLSANRPSIFLYSFDGSMPNLEDSLMTTDVVYLPSIGRSVSINIIAYSEEEYSEVISLTYSTELDLSNSRHLVGEGIDVLPYGEEPIDALSVDYQGNNSRETSQDVNDLDIVTSEYDSKGLPNPDRSSFDFINFPVLIKFSRPPEKDSLDNIYFNPKAKLIRIDGSTKEAYEAQVVRFINRGYGSIDPVKKSSYENPLKKSNLITGNLVRYAYNPTTGIVVFYYFDSKDSRWVISKQKTDKKTFDLSKAGGRQRLGKYVFRWNKDPVFGKLI